MSKYSEIIPEYNIFLKLTKSEIKLYLYLLGNSTYISGDDGTIPLSESNKELAQIFGKNPSTISKQLHKLWLNNLIKIIYIPHKCGTQRYIEVIKTKMEVGL